MTYWRNPNWVLPVAKFFSPHITSTSQIPTTRHLPPSLNSVEDLEVSSKSSSVIAVAVARPLPRLLCQYDGGAGSLDGGDAVMEKSEEKRSRRG
ncbi:hypothetical protein L1887_18149 [Cichorium endivia]|nr:hypothetical protein L1887_18149 [Cichorium endivia]